MKNILYAKPSITQLEVDCVNDAVTDWDAQSAPTGKAIN